MNNKKSRRISGGFFSKVVCLAVGAKDFSPRQATSYETGSPVVFFKDFHKINQLFNVFIGGGIVYGRPAAAYGPVAL